MSVELRPQLRMMETVVPINLVNYFNPAFSVHGSLLLKQASDLSAADAYFGPPYCEAGVIFSTLMVFFAESNLPTSTTCCNCERLGTRSVRLSCAIYCPASQPGTISVSSLEDNGLLGTDRCST
jgi:hypothetical protein